MLLTLENIQNQQFNQRFRGYDMAEVDAFLDKIAESYLFVSTENTKIKEELDAIKNERNQSQEEEQSFKNAIISAQSFADDIKAKAENQASRLKEDAKEKSTAILEEAQNEVTTLQDQISSLAGEKDRIKEELRAFLNSHLARVEDDAITPSPLSPSAEVVSMDQIPEFMEEPDPTASAEEEEEEISTEPELDPALELDVDEEIEKTGGGKDDVAILYEKIDLENDFSSAELPDLEQSELPQAMSMEIDNNDIPEFSTDELEDLGELDDLDGDMLYSLEDPLDLPEPAVVIDPLDDLEEKK